MPDALIALAVIVGGFILLIAACMVLSSRLSRLEEMHSKDPIGWVPEEDAQ